MSETRERLRAALRKVRRSIAQVRERKDHIGEQNTKSVLIDPVLAALGWDLTDLDEVFLEYKHKPQDNPVDYALLLQRSPRLFVEAKELDTNLDDHKWKSQIISYASVAGVEWCVLTDGDRYCIYNAYAPVDVEQKLFRSVIVSDASQDASTLDTLELLSKEKLTENSINVLWKAHFIDRQVQAALEGMFEGEDASLVRLLRKRTTNLKSSEIRESLKRADIVVEFPALASSLVGEPSRADEREAAGEPEAEYGPRSYTGPLLLRGEFLFLARHRQIKGGTTTERVSLADLRDAAEVAGAIASAGRDVTVSELHTRSNMRRYIVQRAVAALYLGRALVYTGGRLPDRFAVSDDLSADAMIERVLAHAQTEQIERGETPRPQGGASQSFRWLVTLGEGGQFTLACRYLPDDTKSFQVRGRRIPPDGDFEPARRKLLEDIYEQIRPLFPDLPDGRVRAKAWSGVHKVYPASAYGKQ